MLPEGFEWREWPNGDWHLYCRGRSVGNVVALENGRARACRCPMVQPSYAFGASFEAGVGYLERWAAQHQDRIREIVQGYETRDAHLAAAHASAPRVEIPPTRHPRRSKRHPCS